MDIAKQTLKKYYHNNSINTPNKNKLYYNNFIYDFGLFGNKIYIHKGGTVDPVKIPKEIKDNYNAIIFAGELNELPENIDDLNIETNYKFYKVNDITKIKNIKTEITDIYYNNKLYDKDHKCITGIKNVNLISVGTFINYLNDCIKGKTGKIEGKKKKIEGKKKDTKFVGHTYQGKPVDINSFDIYIYYANDGKQYKYILPIKYFDDKDVKEWEHEDNEDQPPVYLASGLLYEMVKKNGNWETDFPDPSPEIVLEIQNRIKTYKEKLNKIDVVFEFNKFTPLKYRLRKKYITTDNTGKLILPYNFITKEAYEEKKVKENLKMKRLEKESHSDIKYILLKAWDDLDDLKYNDHKILANHYKQLFYENIINKI